ncbi:sigma 54-interacting transcriptional regulator [uncultured Clostridium sp.]|uniref:sigma-54 interaction domain-containing protein n=1 Tax=uncultured Clostridium sp. TaxID=59620 RepID=UPI00262B56BC|nr:sigma 54-interacting transcriptional regulator [uncultured Clostridium sp.]
MYRDLYKKILDNLYYEVFVTNNEGIVLYCNKAFSNNYCLDTEEIIGKHVSTISPTIKSGKQIIPMVLQEKKEISLFQETIYGKRLFLNAKPILDDNNNIEMVIENAREMLNLSLKQISSNSITSSDLDSITNPPQDNFDDFLKMDIFKNLDKIAQFDVTVLLLGESGTGKSTCAKFIHNLSPRKNSPFFTINCTTIPESLIESELFGYAKGAFTGATKDGKQGLVELANTGTLFLDEIGDLPLSSQSKILELIENKTYIPVGGNSKKKTDIRIITATNKDIKAMVTQGNFREDLYYRLNVIEFNLPPLRDRKNDIPFLATIFLNKMNSRYNLNRYFTQSILLQLKTYDWPGNLRQLEHIIEKIVISNESDAITTSSLEKVFNCTMPEYIDNTTTLPSLKNHLENSERLLILAAYNKYQSSYKVAKALNISQSQASRKIRKYILK